MYFVFRVSLFSLTLLFITCNNPDDRITVLINDEVRPIIPLKNAKFWNPKEVDFKMVDTILEKAINKNLFFFLNEPRRESLFKYYKQYIPYVDERGHRIIMINAFCEIPTFWDKNDEKVDFDWRNNIVLVDDGGDCYWGIKVDLDTQTYFDFMVNGIA